jgi:putative ABC transport system ATP-binding protein
VRLSPKATIFAKLLEGVCGAGVADDGVSDGTEELSPLQAERPKIADNKIQSRKSFMIELYKVSKIVRSGTEMLTILHSLDLNIPDGQFISLVGPSGSGKSTLLGLIAGLDEPTSGEILIDGENITGMNEDTLAELRGEKIGFVFQSFHLMPSLTALENILAPMEIRGLRNARDRAQRLLEDVDLIARAHHYPSQLSGGEQQRVAIARAFANDPSILLADEPTGNLDSRNGRHVFEMMVEMNRKRNATLVLVTHDHELAALADRQISLRDGRVASDSAVMGLRQEIEDTSMEALS